MKKAQRNEGGGTMKPRNEISQEAKERVWWARYGKAAREAVNQLAHEAGLKGKPKQVGAGACSATGIYFGASWYHWQFIARHGQQRLHTIRYHYFQRRRRKDDAHWSIGHWYADHRLEIPPEIEAKLSAVALERKVLRRFQRMSGTDVATGGTRHFVAKKTLH
jgi:hypothetical protein